MCPTYRQTSQARHGGWVRVVEASEYVCCSGSSEETTFGDGEIENANSRLTECGTITSSMGRGGVTNLGTLG